MEETIGFDLRSIVSDPSWTADRRTSYLLRRDVPSVRSVDTLVWERPPGLPRPPVPEGLWPNLSDLFAAAGALDRAGVVAVRITAFGEDEPTPESLDPTGPAAERYDLLGYDVADYWQLSGLTTVAIRPRRRRRWRRSGRLASTNGTCSAIPTMRRRTRRSRHNECLSMRRFSAMGSTS